MFRQYLNKWIARGQSDGYAYLAVCFDTFDAIKGDKDGGYYPVYVKSTAELREEILKRQTGTWQATDVRDFCEYVVDLATVGPNDLQDPQDWLKDNRVTGD